MQSLRPCLLTHRLRPSLLLLIAFPNLAVALTPTHRIVSHIQELSLSFPLVIFRDP